jgi:putative peptidoglycan lipid II flippase
MSLLLWWLMSWMLPNFSADTFTRIWSVTALVVSGAITYFATGYLVGAIDRDRLNLMRRRRPASPVEPS